MEEQFKIVHINGTTTTNRTGYEQYLQAQDARYSHGRYTIEEAALAICAATDERPAQMLENLIQAVLDGELTVHEPGKHAAYLPKVVREFYAEAYWNDLNNWLVGHQSRILWRFQDPETAELASIAQPIEAPEVPAPELVESVLVQMAAPEHAEPRTRTDNLSHAMKIGFSSYKEKHHSEPTARALFDWLATNDETEKIIELDDDGSTLTWTRSDGGLSDTSFKAFQGRFTRLKRKQS